MAKKRKSESEAEDDETSKKRKERRVSFSVSETERTFDGGRFLRKICLKHRREWVSTLRRFMAVCLPKNRTLCEDDDGKGSGKRERLPYWHTYT